MQNLQVRCSSLFKLMTQSKGADNMEKYLKLKETLEQERAKYEAIANKETKPAINKLQKIMDLTNQAIEAEKIKDVWILSTTAKSYIKEEAKKLFYGYTTEIDTKEMRKGHMNEDEGINLLNSLIGSKFSKNTERKEFVWLTGEADIVDKKGGRIFDIKNPWSLETFPAFKEDADAKLKAAGYDWQQIGYLMLWKLDEAFIVYTMTETPGELLNDWDNLSIHQVNHIDPKKRITISSPITKTKEIEDQIKRAYKAGNEYFKQLLTELQSK